MKRPIEAGIHVGGPATEDTPESRLREALRETASRWASGVAVVAVRDGGNFEAITVTSFITASLDPPTVVVSIARQAVIVPLLDAAGRWTVSVLASDQRRAASMIADRVPGVISLFSPDSDPVLSAALHALVCRTDAVHDAGDHRLYVAAVEQVIPGRSGAPLLYHERGYAKLAEKY